MGKKSPKSQTVTQKTEIPPQYSRALDFILGQGMGLANQYLGTGGSGYPASNGRFAGLGGPAPDNGEFAPPPIIPGFDENTLKGLDSLSVNTNPNLTGNLLSTIRGDDLNESLTRRIIPGQSFKALNRAAVGHDLYGGRGFNQAVDAAVRQAMPHINSTFGAAGRSGSGLAQTAIAQAATDAFAGHYANERANQMSAAGTLANIGASTYNNERARQLAAIPQLQALNDKRTQNLLTAGGIREDRQREQLMEPFTRFNLVTDPIIRAIGGAPTSTTTTQPLHRNTGAGLLGGALGGAGLGQALGFAGAGPLAPFAIGGALLGGIL